MFCNPHLKIISLVAMFSVFLYFGVFLFFTSPEQERMSLQSAEEELAEYEGILAKSIYDEKQKATDDSFLKGLSEGELADEISYVKNKSMENAVARADNAAPAIIIPDSDSSSDDPNIIGPVSVQPRVLVVDK